MLCATSPRAARRSIASRLAARDRSARTALVDAAHDRLGRRVDAVGLVRIMALPPMKVCTATGSCRPATPGILNAFLVPRLHGLAAGDVSHVFAAASRSAAGTTSWIRPRLWPARPSGPCPRAGSARRHDADQARDALRAAAARQQADLDLGLADLGPRYRRRCGNGRRGRSRSRRPAPCR